MTFQWGRHTLHRTKRPKSVGKTANATEVDTVVHNHSLMSATALAIGSHEWKTYSDPEGNEFCVDP